MVGKDLVLGWTRFPILRRNFMASFMGLESRHRQLVEPNTYIVFYFMLFFLTSRPGRWSASANTLLGQESFGWACSSLSTAPPPPPSLLHLLCNALFRSLSDSLSLCVSMSLYPQGLTALLTKGFHTGKLKEIRSLFRVFMSFSRCEKKPWLCCCL